MQLYWRPISTAPTDGSLIIVATNRHDKDLGPLVTVCRYRPDAGFTVDELRYTQWWMPLPPAPIE